MSAQFSFSFSGEDIEDDEGQPQPRPQDAAQPTPAVASAFPVAGKSLLPAVRHDLKHMLSQLPSKIAYSLLPVDLDGNGELRLPRRELWDVRVQLMAEEGEGSEAEPGLGNHDVKTGVYEGGFKSWECSVDLVKVLATSNPPHTAAGIVRRVIELGCGTALPSLALFHWALDERTNQESSCLSLVLADYNPTVLQLVTLPNFILTWALHHSSDSPLLRDAFATEGELELSAELIEAFQAFLINKQISLTFLSGAWSPEFVDLLHSESTIESRTGRYTMLLGAETIYSPFALGAFTQTVFSVLEYEKAHGNMAEAFVGAKKLYFGVGGSLDDFIIQARDRGACVEQVREEAEGVRRGVVRCNLSS
ncbi:hypothetical protein F4780DRAFT_581118 [Xylariomycetidae sp. FL0641]|nr:hypothetical protein F4780DRAFT_581118 [Xylariomycetidae sp. FL0641]